VIRLGIVDDHPVFRLGLRKAMDRHKRLTVAWDIGDATRLNEAVASSAVDMVLVDLNLGTPPDGLAATRALLREHPKVKVVILTASVDADTALAARKAGADGYLLKDMGLSEMLAAIEHVAFSNGGATFVNAALDAQRRSDAGASPGVRGLSRRENEVVEQLKKGRTNREIAARLGISVTTVNKHVQQVLKKLNVRNRSEAIVRLTGDEVALGTEAARR
jgi:DNA-binding NarL/FixJ family response regulator